MTAKEKAQENLKQLIESLKALHNRGAGLVSYNIHQHVREARQGEKNWNEYYQGYTNSGEKNFELRIEIYDPKSIK